MNLSKSIGNPGEAVKFLFDSEDLLDTGISIRNPRLPLSQSELYLGLLKVPLPALDLDEILFKFPELSCLVPQLGMDECSTGFGTRYTIQRHEEGEAIGAAGNTLDARKYMRRGVPPSLRMRIWRIAYGLSDAVIPVEERNFSRLRSDCDRLDLITDELFLHDIQTITDDPRFFVFEVLRYPHPSCFVDLAAGRAEGGDLLLLEGSLGV